MSQQVAFINESTNYTDAMIAQDMAAIQEQMSRDVGPAWAFQCQLNQIPKGDPNPLNQWWMVYMDTADQAGALGYHDLTNASMPMGKIFVETTKSYGQTVSRVASHETGEMMVDPFMNRTVLINGLEYMVEVGDPLSLDGQGDMIGDVMMSGIALPAYYFTGYGTNYDKRGILQGMIPNAVDGTYLMWKQNGVWQNKMFALSPDEAANDNHRKYMEPAVGSRRHRRMRGLASWIPSVVKLAA